MKLLRGWLLRLAGILPNEQRERERADEIESNLQLHIDDNLRAGMSPEQARRNAILKLGGVESTKCAYRDGSTVPFLEDLLQDVRFSIRQLRNNLGFTSTAILMLALGMCASVAIFAFVDAALIKPLPYRNPERLVGVYESTALWPQDNISYPDYLDWKRLNKVFGSLDAYERTGFMLTTREGSQASHGTRVTDGFFRTLGVAPVLGRDFYPGEDLSSAARAVMLSYAIWQNKYGGKSDVLGKAVVLNGEANIIIGVLPRNFHFAPAEPADFWTALHASGECDLRRGCHSLYGVARLKDGTSVQSALSNVTVIAQQLAKQYPGSNQGQGASLMPLTEVVVGNLRPILLVLLSGTWLLLLIACVNIASLLLVRAESRRREMAVRSALGASSIRLVRQFVMEGLVLTAAGGALGVASAYWTIQLLSSLVPTEMMASMPAFAGLGLNPRLVAYAGLLLLLALVLFSLTPALHFSFSKMYAGLTEGTRGSAGNAWRRLGSKLVVVELATAVVLLVGAGLLGKSFYRMLNVKIGFTPEHLVSLQIAPPITRYRSDEKAIALGRHVVSRITNIPGVQSAGICSQLPVSFNGQHGVDQVCGPAVPWRAQRR